jgi:hypothetical protein
VKRSPLKRKRPMRRTKRSAYARRPRDTAFMLWVKTLLCAVEEEWPLFPVKPTPCDGVIEADHMGARGLGRKADDSTCVPMCSNHHRERSDHAGTFRAMTKEQLRTWRGRAMLRTQTLWAEQRGLT